MSGSLEAIQEQMRQLKLVRTAEELPLLLQDASKREASYTELLQDLLGRELSAKQDRHAAMKTTMARFPKEGSTRFFKLHLRVSREAAAEPSNFGVQPGSAHYKRPKKRIIVRRSSS